MNINELEKSLYFHNPWWIKNVVPLELIPPFRRPILNQLNKYLDSLERIIIIKGPRRTGKTTLIFQLIENLISKKAVNPYNILFLSFDDLNLRQDLDRIFHTFERIRGKTLKGDLIYCFLDEVHFLEEWSFFVKKYFDKKYPIKFLVSSSSASLFKKSLESLAGRTVEERLLPFTFKELVLYHFREDENFLKLFHEGKYTPYESELQILFQKYLVKGGFPNLLEIGEPSLWQKLLREDVLEKVIYRDLTQLYGVRDPEKLEKTFLYLANTTGQIVNLFSLAKNIGMSRQHLGKYIYYLEQAYLVFQLQQYSHSTGKTARSPTKLHLIDSGLGSVFSTVTNQDFIVEGVIARHFWESEERTFYYRNYSEIDLIVKREREVIPVEIKNKERPDRDDFKGLIFFMKKFNLQEGLLLCRDYRGIEEKEGLTIRIEPFWLWLLKNG